MRLLEDLAIFLVSSGVTLLLLFWLLSEYFGSFLWAIAAFVVPSVE
jgi:hypothetical protein